MELSSAFSSLSPQNFPLKKFLILFPKKTCSEKVSYIFSKKAPFIKKIFFYILGKVFSEPWHIQNPRHTQNTVKHLLWNVLQKCLPSALSYVPGNEAFLINISLIF